MFLKIFIFVVVVGAAVCKPQLLTFDNGNVGVNFGGYHAAAGLGGLLTGNNAHGGLSASAGTPHGQRAGAGIGGSVGGRTLGGAYAGATAGEGIGASAGLGGSVGQGGILGANAQAGGHGRTTIKKIELENQAGQTNTIQKIKPPKKYIENSENHVLSSKTDTKSDVIISKPEVNKPLGIASDGQQFNQEQQPQVFVYRKRLRPFRRRLHLRKQIVPVFYESVKEVGAIEHNRPITPVNVVKTKQVYFNNPAPATRISASAEGNIGGSNFFDSIFNIPISTLRAVNGFLNQGLGGGVGIKKTVDVHTY